MGVPEPGRRRRADHVRSRCMKATIVVRANGTFMVDTVKFEGFIVAEIVKNQVNRGLQRQVYFFRDERGLEVDLLFPAPGGKLHLVEPKWSKTIRPEMAAPLQKLRAAFATRAMPSDSAVP
jgi:hypothetical protein